MPFNGAGVYAPPGADFPAVALTLIESAKYNDVINDISVALTTCITKDGQTIVTANIPFAGFALTGVGSGLAARTRAANIGDVQDGTTQWAVAGGTVDVITAVYAPALTALIDGQLCYFRALGANTVVAPTFSPNGLTARAITKRGGTALIAGDIPAALSEVLLRYNLANTRWELQNPATLTIAGGTDGQALSKDSTASPTYVWVDNPSRPNLMLNGAWRFDQINEGALYTINTTGQSGPDGCQANAIGGGVFKLRTVVDPDNAALKCLEITCTTADAAIGAADLYELYFPIEGYNAADLLAGTASARQATVQFKYKTSITGVYGVSIVNAAGNRSYIGIITVANTNENEYSLVLTMDTAGTWLYTNGVGLYLYIDLAAGSNYQDVAGIWHANSGRTTAAQCNFMSNVANIAYLKRVQLIPGGLVQAYQTADMQKELARIQRQYCKSYSQGVVAGTVTNLGRSVGGVFAASTSPVARERFPVEMRSTPTMIGYSPSNGTSGKWDDGVAVNQTPSFNTGTAGFDGLISAGTLTAVTGHWTANARLG